MKTRKLIALGIVLLVMALSGCLRMVDYASIQPFEQKLKIVASDPESHLVRVSWQIGVPLAVARDGGIALSVPRLSGGGATYLLGVPIGKNSGADEKCVFIMRGQQSVKRLSVKDLRKLPRDTDGYSVLQISR